MVFNACPGGDLDSSVETEPKQLDEEALAADSDIEMSKVSMELQAAIHALAMFDNRQRADEQYRDAVGRMKSLVKNDPSTAEGMASLFAVRPENPAQARDVRGLLEDRIAYLGRLLRNRMQETR